MADAHSALADLRRYADLIQGVLVPGGAPELVSCPNDEALTVESAIGYTWALVGTGPDPAMSPFEPAIDRALAGEDLRQMTVVDREGHRRPVYRWLLGYSLVQTYRLIYASMPAEALGRWDHALRRWGEAMEACVEESPVPGGGAGQIPASQGPAAVEAAWAALGLVAAGKALNRLAWVDLAIHWMGKLAKFQTPCGTFLAASPSDNPETHWYHELLLLHAAASYAVQVEDRAMARAVQRNTEFHLNETQPDHASNQPWGIFAFTWNPQTRIVADQMLHAATTLERSPLASILLADALYCLRLFEPAGKAGRTDLHDTLEASAGK